MQKPCTRLRNKSSNLFNLQSERQKAMTEDVKILVEEFKKSLEKSITHTINEFSKIRAGKAHPTMLDGVMVEYYGNATPLQQVANVSAPDARTLAIQPWERQLIQDVERAIINSNLGFAPQNDGHTIRITIPPLTQERRLQLVKMAKQEAEQSKVSIRNIRKDANEKVKRMQKEGLAEDIAKDTESQIQKFVDNYIAKVDQLTIEKEKEIMTI